MRNIGTYKYTCTLRDDTQTYKGWHVMTHEGLAVVTGILERPNEGYYVDVVVYGGNPSGQSFRPWELRAATFGEFCSNKTGFGKTSWIQFTLIQAVALALSAGGVWTFGEGGWSTCVVFAAIEAVMIYGTWRNFKGRQA